MDAPVGDLHQIWPAALTMSEELVDDLARMLQFGSSGCAFSTRSRGGEYYVLRFYDDYISALEFERVWISC